MNEQVTEVTNEVLNNAMAAVDTAIKENLKPDVMDYATNIATVNYNSGMISGLIVGVTGVMATVGTGLIIYKLTHKKKETEVTETTNEE